MIDYGFLEYTTLDQTKVFLYACVLGVTMGLFYELFRILRLAVPCGRITVFIQDIVFFVVCGFLSFFFMLIFNNGTVRGFIIIANVLGMIVYLLTFGKLINKSAGFIIKAVKSILNFIKRPFVWIERKVKSAIRRFLKTFSRKKKKKDKKESRHSAKALEINETAII